MNFKILILQCLALLRSVIATCYDEINVDDQLGRLMSPGYPFSYYNDANCTWVLTAPENYRIELTFLLPFEIETCNDICDWVRVYDGSTILAPKIVDFAGTGSSTTKHYSTYNTMTVQLHSDRSATRRGFSANFIKVQGPKFVSKPGDVEIAGGSGQTVNMTCRVTGFPTPLINWTHNGVEVVTGGRFTIQPNGDLEITDVEYADRGTYTCIAENEIPVPFIRVDATLTVRNRTVIKRDYPSSGVHNVAADGSPVHISCVVSEYDKILNVSVEWKRNDERINSSTDSRISIVDTKRGHRIISSKLTIDNVSLADAGRYYCVAKTRMDEDSDDVRLNVIKKPNPPRVTKVQCHAKSAEVSWQSTEGALATSFIVQHSSSFAPDIWETGVDNISASEQDYTVRVPLSPWQNYTFRVLARNQAGFSDPSKHFSHLCSTDEDVPKNNPDNVTAQQTEPATLVITWTPLSPKDYQGSQFFYQVWWKPNIANASWQSVKLIDWNEGEYVVNVESTPQEYVIFVLAGNVKGVAVQPVQKVYAYAGQAKLVSRSDYNKERAASRH